MNHLFVTIIFIIAIIIFLFVIIRSYTYKELDDLHPLIPCKQKFLDKSKYIWIIPFYKKVPITNYPEWCKMIKDLEKKGKILGMHGVEHTQTHGLLHNDSEFNSDVPIEKIKYGMEIFKNAFGHYPLYFKAPQLKCTKKNQRKIESLGMIYKNFFNQIMHRVYHCDDENNDFYMREYAVDLF